MRGMAHPRIVRAAPDRLSALASMFGRAFGDEPMMRWPMGEHGDVVDRSGGPHIWFMRSDP
jgi:hypothetical protein